MSSKLSLACLLLVACSGSTGAEIMSAPTEEPNRRVSVAPEEDASAPAIPQPDATPEPAADAGTDASQDAGEDASQPDDGGADADAAVDAAPPVPRYGVTFDGSVGSALAVQAPASLGGQANVTMEAYYRLNSATDRGLIFSTPKAYCAVSTGGPATIHCCAWKDGGGNSCVQSPVVANQGVWYHVAWVLSAGSWTLFVNGQKQGDVPSVYQTYPTFPANSGTPNIATHILFGSDNLGQTSSVGSVDEFRLTHSALYAADFAPAKHLDAAGAVNLLLDEGAGATSGPATLYGTAAWITVSR